MGRTHLSALWRVLGLLGAAGLLAACGASADAGPTWVPQPSVSTEAGGHGQVPNPGPGGSGPSGGGAPTQAPQSPGSSNPGGGGPTDGVVASRLDAPTGLALLPDGSALVGERTTGRIVRVRPQGGPVEPVRTLPGLATTGDGGLLDLALSPTYAQDGLIYAYTTTGSDNRVIDFTLTGPAAPVLTGIPRGATGNTGRLVFDAKGQLYVGTGDTGSPQLAANPTSLAGKVLRVDGIGHPVAGNAAPGSPVFTRGHHTVDGLCASAALDIVIESEAPAEVNVLTSAGNYGWPNAAAGSVSPARTLPSGQSGLAGCAVQASTLYVVTTDGQSMLSAPVTAPAKIGPLTVVKLPQGLGRLRTVVAAPDGALWVTTTNKDGHGHPAPADERVIRLIPPPSGGGGPPV
jgi:glucose/arabinose dehydrogenase